MNVSKKFKEYFIPFMEKFQFELIQHKSNNFYIFQHCNQINQHVYCTVRTGGKGLSVSLDRGSGIPFNLSYFLYHSDEMELAVGDGFWYFDNEEELLGALEEQVDLLSTKGFNWLQGNLSPDPENILNDIQMKRAKFWESSTDEEREKAVNSIAQGLKNWEKRRVKPRTGVE